MALIAKWKNGARYSADAQKCMDEIFEICHDIGSALPSDILDKAKDEETELHKCFTWDDSVAAEKYRLQEARKLVTLMVIKEDPAPVERPEIRVFYKTYDNSGYKPTELIFKQDDEYNELLKRAQRELRAFKAKYSMLREFDEIFALID